MAYWLGETLFVKRYAYDPTAEYPDMGCNTEVFTNADMLELETLSPLIDAAPRRRAGAYRAVVAPSRRRVWG
jgi:hypothetical protein